MGIKAHYLQDNNKEKFYPYAHADATFDRDGEKVGTVLDELKQSVTEAQNVQPDWNETDNSSDAYIKNKPTEMPASDVPDWAKAETKPTYTATEVGADAAGSANSALSSAKAYTDEKVDALNDAIDSKVDKVSGKGLSTNDYTTTEKNKLSGIASGAEVNQNAFSNVTVGSSTIAADSKTDTLTLAAGSNITLTPDTTNDKVTISATNTTYSPAGSALGLVKTGGDVTISDGTITVNDDSHNHTIANVDGLQTTLNEKSDSNHTHTVDSSLSSSSTNPVQNKVINTALAGKVPTSRTVNGKALSANITLSASDVGADAEGSADTALTEAKSYTDTKVSALVNGAPETLDTLGELADAMEENDDAIAALESIAASKANASDLTSHTGNSTIHITSTERSNWNAAKTHADSAHAPSNAEVNQNAFSNITVGNTTIAADTKTDTLTLAGSNVTLTPDATNDKVTIGITKANVTAALGYTPSESDTTYNVATADNDGLMSAADKTKLDGIATGANKYTHPSYTAKSSGLYKVTVDATGHVSATVAVAKSDITALGIPAQDTTYGAATTSAAGLMSASDKSKLDGIASGANKYTLPTASSSTLGGVKTTSTVTSTTGLTACPIISGVPYYKDTNSTYTLSTFGITATAAELNYVDGVTSNIQTQLNAKAPTSHNHNGTYPRYTTAASEPSGQSVGDHWLQTY